MLPRQQQSKKIASVPQTGKLVRTKAPGFHCFRQKHVPFFCTIVLFFGTAVQADQTPFTQLTSIPRHISQGLYPEQGVHILIPNQEDKKHQPIALR